jgi:hypothetical protein
MMAYRGSRDINPFILNLGFRWRCVVNITPRLLYPLKITPVPIEYETG